MLGLFLEILHADIASDITTTDALRPMAFRKLRLEKSVLIISTFEYLENDEKIFFN